MMLHEAAVMLELYRQAAIQASEMASPRCQSRESSGGGRCPSDESMHSGRGLPQLPVSPVGLGLPPNLSPAAAALLPQHSAAMAAYIVAAQQNQLLAAGLRARAGSPQLLPIPSPLGNDSGILDFSKKTRSSDSSENENENDNASDHDDDSVVNLSSKSGEDNPLDLSCSNRKRPSESASPPARKMTRNDYKPIVSPWNSPVTPQLPYFAQAMAQALSPKQNNHQNEWNGKNKNQGTNEAAKALEKMSELSRLGGDEVYRPRETSSTSGSGAGGRHSAWQSHWLNKGADSAKDVLKCVWCKQSFNSLAALTTHMKETKHCGVSVPPPSNQSQSNNAPERTSSSSSSSNSREKETNLNLLIKETMPLPRKLVRGQDVWLGKGAEQTRQILKCMWCGQSFRTLAEMTTHMQQTQHYTNIISQEQIISWKSNEPGEKGRDGGSGSGSESSAGTNPSTVNTSSTVSAVLTCKVCDQAFSSLKELSNHMVKNAHYKEHIMRSITESGGRRRQTREKRKKSLPVRKLLELERAQHDFKNGQISPGPGKPLGDMSAGRITCEKCNDKIETSVFVDHIRQCVGGVPLSASQKLKSNLLSNTIIPPDSVSPVPSSGRKSTGDDLSSPGLRQKSPTDLSSNSGKDNKSSSPSVLNAIEQLIEKSFDTRSRHTNTFGNAGSQSTTPLGASILKRLGIDESVDYTKPLMDPQTMGLLRNYHYGTPFRGRERSGSESSSISERGSSRVDSLTPDKKFDTPNHGMTPRATPDKHSERDENSDDEKRVNVKREVTTDDEDEDLPLKRKENKENEKDCADVKIKKEKNEDEVNSQKRRNSQTISSPTPSPRINSSVPLSPATSPAASDSHTPRSTPGPDSASKKNSSSCLGALSSMFDSLTNSNLKANNPSDLSTNSGKKPNAHPLAALQKLCDKTENNRSNNSSGAQSSPLMSTSASNRGGAGGILAFSWACNDALQGDDATIKCTFCDTTFNSRGAHRHHMSKVHFMNEENLSETSSAKNLVKSEPHSPLSPKHNNNSNASSGNGAPLQLTRPDSKDRDRNIDEEARSPSLPPASTTPSSFQDESPHSKFLKYTELAKQLSSKYV
uniref:CSON009983 protein n=1 Tax=Culicoides sonorensis TaxID=179676 RepID=A0A336LKI7_CULSO